MHQNKKTGKIYLVIDNSVKNTTNEQDGQVMVLYRNVEEPEQMFVREKEEFKRKFRKL